jgi:hypothetical protein
MKAEVVPQLRHRLMDIGILSPNSDEGYQRAVLHTVASIVDCERVCVIMRSDAETFTIYQCLPNKT